MKRLVPVALAAAALLAGCSSDVQQPSSPQLGTSTIRADFLKAPDSTAVPDQYIVILKQGASFNARAMVDTMAVEQGARVLHRYHSALQGMALKLTPTELNAMRSDPRVAYIEQDARVKSSATETNAPWGLDRIDQHALPLNTTYIYGADGSGVTVYMLDSGILFTHNEFGGRAVAGIDEVTPGGTAADCEGHGTNTSGIVGGTTYGVAKNVKLVSVRITDCNGHGTNSQVLAGIDWVTANRTLPAVANMSAGGSFSTTVNQSVQNLIASGVTFVDAAGNSAADACNASPASAPGALSVASSSKADGFSTFSSFGSCVGMIAPGENIPTAAIASNTATAVVGGTSFASPHVAGAAALYLQVHPSATPAQVVAAIEGNATMNAISNVPAATPNRLLYTGFIAPLASAPVAAIASSCTSLTCSFDASGSTALASATYAWTFGDGATATGKTTSHTYSAGGTYSVTLTVTDANGTGSNTVSVSPASAAIPPVARFTYSCPTLQCSLDASTSTGNAAIVRYAWTWGDGRAEAHPAPTVKNTWRAAGTYTISLTVTDANGLTGNTSQQIQIPTAVTPPPNQPPTAAISTPANNTSVVQGTNVTFTGSGTDPEDGTLGGASLVWKSSINGQIGTGTSFNTTTLSVGTHTITLTAADSKGATGTATITLTVTSAPPVNQPPVANFTVTCPVPGLPVPHACTLDATSSTDDHGVVAWLWSYSKSADHSSAQIQKHNFGAAGQYTVTLTVTDAGGLTSTLTKVIAVP